MLTTQCPDIREDFRSLITSRVHTTSEIFTRQNEMTFEKYFKGIAKSNWINNFHLNIFQNITLVA